MQNKKLIKKLSESSDSNYHDEDVDDDCLDESNEFNKMDREQLIQFGFDQMSPIPVLTKNTTRRRKQQQDEDDDDDDDEDDDSSDDKLSKSIIDSPRKKKVSSINQNKSLKPIKWNYLKCFTCFIASLAFIGIIGHFLLITINAEPMKSIFFSNEKNQNIELTIKNLRKNINDIKLIFTKQDNSIWKDVEGRIYEVIVKKKRPAVIFLFSWNDQPMFCLAKLFGNVSRVALNSDEELFLTAGELIDDYGLVIEDLKEKILRQKVVIFENILDINTEAMQAFHNLCDDENPLVRNAIYIFTMIVNNRDNNIINKKMNTRESMKFIENELTQRLTGKINQDKLQPLITRMTDAVIIHVQSEPDIKSCPLRY